MKVEFTTGNFDLVFEGELNEDAKQKFLNAGLTYVVQRDVASKTYLELCGVENEKGKKQLPKDFERKSLEFSDENLAKLTETAKQVISSYGNFTVSGTQHVSGADVSPMKRATEFVDSLLGNAQNEAQLRQFVGMYGATGNEDRETLIKLVHDNVPGFAKAKPKAE